MEEELLKFAEEESQEESSSLDNGCWKILIVDDEIEIHSVTKMALEGIEFDNKKLSFFSAYSAKEAKEILKEHPDIAMIFLDVVMEESDAGLKLVKYIREELKNNQVRIVLRTGQPGQAPEKQVVRDYDINDYRTKTELTSQKLTTTLYSALRSYRDIVLISTNKAIMEKIVSSSASIFEIPYSTEKFTSITLENLISILSTKEESNRAKESAFIAQKVDDGFKVLAGIGRYEQKDDEVSIPEDLKYSLDLVLKNKKSLYSQGDCIIFVPSKKRQPKLVYVEKADIFEYLNKDLLEIFGTNIGVAFDNILLNEEIKKTEREVVYAMGMIAETRSKETGNHVKRVAEYSKIIALNAKLSQEEAEILRQASPLHDLGKIAIPDEILNKPAKHTPQEWEIMKTHTKIGYEMLKDADTEVLKSGAIIALEHHEKWDGSGYPNGLKGDEIHIYGRVVAIADVFDALGSDRCYKKAWELDKILDYFKEQRGKHFDPYLVDIFFDSLDQILQIRNELKDM